MWRLHSDLSQMSEEIDNAALNVPRAIVTTMILNGATGFAMVLAVLFCLGDIESVLVCLLPFTNGLRLMICTGFTYRVSVHPGIL